jgi:hypothetical protein
MISEFKQYHGTVFAELIDESTIPIKLFRPDLSNNAIYVLNDRVGLYIKHSTSRISPWRFTFHPSHLIELWDLSKDTEDLFVVLVCGRNSMAVIDVSEAESLLPKQSRESCWISVRTGHNTMLEVEGTLGSLRRKIRKSKPFDKVRPLLEKR